MCKHQKAGKDMRFGAILFAGLIALLSLCASNESANARGDDPSDSIDSDAYLIPTKTREEVKYDGNHAPGTIIVDTKNRVLYLVLKNKKAIRYGVGVGREGYSWSGVSYVSRKAEWPGWTPPWEMRQREPWLPAYMPGGEGNPLGARALYLGATLYRIHGTSQARTIGNAVSSGCIRMLNNEVIELYELVQVGAKVIVQQ